MSQPVAGGNKVRTIEIYRTRDLGEDSFQLSSVRQFLHRLPVIRRLIDM